MLNVADPLPDPEGPFPASSDAARLAGTLTLRKAFRTDAAFVDALTRETMDHYVRKTWSAEAEVEHYFEKNRFVQETTRIVQFNGKDIGRLTLLWSPGEVFVDNIHIRPEFHNGGLGGTVLKRVIQAAQDRGLTVRLQCLLANPAAHLYRRLGFHEYSRNGTHLFFILPAAAGRVT